MNWLTNFVRPKIQSIVQKDVPDNLWEKCPACGNMIFHRELEQNFRVCPECSYHMRLPAAKRLELLFDQGEFSRIELPEVAHDPLKFRDLKKYSDRLKDSKKRSGEEDALLVAHGSMGGQPVVVAAFEFKFMGGSMGSAVGEAIVAAADLAVLQEAALIIVPSSGGARMQEGILSLMQMARTTVAVNKVKEKGLPYICLLTDPTTGGVTASFAMLGDIHVAEPGCVIGFAGARVIENTIRESLPEGFQRAEYLLEHGMVDMVVHRHELREKLSQVIALLMNPTPSGALLSIDGKKAPAKKAKKTARTSSSRKSTKKK